MDLSAPQAAWLAAWVRGVSGLALDPDDLNFLELRLASVLRAEGLESFQSLIELLQSGAAGRALCDEVVSSLTSHDTSFFRGREVFEALREQVLPGLSAARAPGQRVRMWCAACSTGQEAYSLAIVARELGWTRFEAEIRATDISRRAVLQAREGVYSQMEVNHGLTSAHLDAHFIRDGRHWRVRPALAVLVDFAEHNLVRDPAPEDGLDLILCRNVLIYFDPPTRAALEQRLAAALRPGGVLLLGADEVPEPAAGLAPSPVAAAGFYRALRRAA